MFYIEIVTYAAALLKNIPVPTISLLIFSVRIIERSPETGSEESAASSQSEGARAGDKGAITVSEERSREETREAGQ